MILNFVLPEVENDVIKWAEPDREYTEAEFFETADRAMLTRMAHVREQMRRARDERNTENAG